ncbi:MAG: glyoxalase [Flavobacteriales bacterium]|nr:glyoxalase [Flavobacteriales bacterium]
MIKCQPIIAVHDVEKSSKWYQELLGCQSMHGGGEFEMLGDERNEVFLCLHKWALDNHPTMANPETPADNGLILYIQVNDLESTWQKAKDLGAKVEVEPHLSVNSHKREFSVRDLDGYYVTVTA